ncbi:MAG: hypothetical protein LBH28_11895 [Oscillospiraceae bacterium]|jgi:hypothetical protein|nr:hypothetical protein [Oscillospiraceae bacterium]
MKNRLLLITVILSMLLMLLAGSASAFERKENMGLPDADTPAEIQEISLSISGDGTAELGCYSLPLIPTFSFSSVEELCRSLANDFTDEILTEIESAERTEFKGTFREFLEGRRREDRVYVPYCKEEMVPLENREGYSNVTLLPSEALLQTWIWFHCRVNGEDVIIKMMYLDDGIVQDANNKGCSWFLSQSSFEVPNVHNIESFPRYKKIYEKEIKLKDRTANALVYEVVDDPRDSVSFIYDDIMVTILYKSESRVINDEWFSQLSFKPVPIGIKKDNPPVTSIKIGNPSGPMPSMSTVPRNSVHQLGVSVNGGAVAPNADIVWTVSDMSFASIDANGKLAIKNKAGTLVLTAKEPASGTTAAIVLRIT